MIVHGKKISYYLKEKHVRRERERLRREMRVLRYKGMIYV
jgi:hypothetical protein